MQITDVKIYPMLQGTLRGYADVTFDNCLSVREFRLERTRTGYKVCVPNVKQQDGTSNGRLSHGSQNAEGDRGHGDRRVQKSHRRKYPEQATSMAAYLVRDLTPDPLRQHCVA